MAAAAAAAAASGLADGAWVWLASAAKLGRPICRPIGHVPMLTSTDVCPCWQQGGCLALDWQF